MSSFKPRDPGPWFSTRHEAVKRFRALGLQTGDILVRLGDAFMRLDLSPWFDVDGLVRRFAPGMPLRAARVELAVPFSPIIAEMTGSKYSHAALVYDVPESGAGPVMVADVNERGLRLESLVDWIDAIRSEEVPVLRHKRSSPKLRHLLRQTLEALVRQDPAYDAEFKLRDKNLYCVEMCYEVYQKARAPLGRPTPMRELPGWSKWHQVFAAVGEVDDTSSVYHVGDEKSGLLGSEVLRVVGVVGRPEAS